LDCPERGNTAKPGFEFYDATTKVRVQSPDDLKAYDPALYGILDRIYARHHIPADVYYGRNLRPAAAVR
jgi:hypothetical protein